MTDAATPPADGPIVFFDGECGLCNGFVDFAMARDRGGRLRYAPLQGETAELRLPEEFRGMDSVVLLRDGKPLQRSSAVAGVLWELGGLWRFAGRMLRHVPYRLREFGYRIVAKNRYRLFGKRDACRMPTPEERGRILP